MIAGLTRTAGIAGVDQAAADVRPGRQEAATAQVITVLPQRVSIPARAWRWAVRQSGQWWWRYRLASFGRRSLLRRPALVVGGRAIAIGARTEIWPQARMEALNAQPGAVRIQIGDGVVIQPGIHIGAALSVRIGDGTMIASRVYITDHDHDFRNPDEPAVTNRRVIACPVDIGHHVWLGEGVMVLKGVTLGDHCVIGAGSVVTHDVPPYSVAVGVPARVVSRFDPGARRWVKVQGT